MRDYHHFYDKALQLLDTGYARNMDHVKCIADTLYEQQLKVKSKGGVAKS